MDGASVRKGDAIAGIIITIINIVAGFAIGMLTEIWILRIRSRSIPLTGDGLVSQYCIISFYRNGIIVTRVASEENLVAT